MLGVFRVTSICMMMNKRCCDPCFQWLAFCSHCLSSEFPAAHGYIQRLCWGRWVWFHHTRLSDLEITSQNTCRLRVAISNGPFVVEQNVSEFRFLVSRTSRKKQGTLPLSVTVLKDGVSFRWVRSFFLPVGLVVSPLGRKLQTSVVCVTTLKGSTSGVTAFSWWVRSVF